MKKILLILLVFYNFSFSATYFDGIGICENGQIYDRGDGYLYVSSIGDNSYNNCSWDYQGYEGTFAYYETSGLPDAKCAYIVEVDNGDSQPCLHEFYVKLYKNDCADDEHLDLDTGECVSVCPDGYKTDPDNSEECIPDCSQNVPTLATPPLGWNVYTDINSSSACQDKAVNDSFLYDDFSFSSMTDDRGCVYNACYINEFNPEPCINENDPMAHLPDGYIFKGIASSDVVCRSMVDGIYYLNYQTYLVHNDCPTDTSVFCYLKKGLDNNENGLDINESYETYPDGTIDPIDIPSLDTNNSNISTFDFNSTSQTNNLITQLSTDVKDFVNVFKASDDYWKRDNQLKFDSRTANDNLNNQNLINANNANTNKINDSISGLTSKLDTLIGSDTTDKSSEVLSDISNIDLPDLNYSSDIDSNFSTSFTTDELTSMVSSQYSDFSDRAINALLDSFNTIDYGVLDFFTIQDYDFQDYYLPELHFLGATFSGKLMDSVFLNSLPWSYLRLALLLATLLAGVKYILDRLF